MASNCDLVRDFIGAWEARDLEGILSRMTPDATYLNVGLSEAKGHEAIRATIGKIMGKSGFQGTFNENVFCDSFDTRL